MMAWLRGWLGRVWPVLRLRSIMFGMLLLVAALPGVAAIMLRVYENALVRRTEAELIAQGSALAASAAMVWPGAITVSSAPARVPARAEDDSDIVTQIDLRSSPVLPERPAALVTTLPPDPDALTIAHRMAPVLASTRQETLAAILLLDRHGTALDGRDAGRSLAALPEVRQALAGHPATVLRHNGAYTHPYPLEWISRGTDLRLHYARPIFVNGQVVGVALVSRSPSALFRGMWEDRGKIALGTGVIFLLLIGMTGLLARTIVRPIEALGIATRALAEGRRADPPRPTLRVREIDGLIQDFATMAAAIELRSHYLRDFAAALAHEFKTPLAGIAGGIELLQDHGAAMAEAERARFLANMAGDAERLTRLITRLMELARAEMRTAMQAATCNGREVLALLADGLAAEDFAIRLVTLPELPALAIDAPALETVLAILIDNARQAGASEIVISAVREARLVRLKLADDGPGIPVGDVTRIFEPFFTSKRGQGGTGLGLSIARALIQSHHGRLDHRPSTNGAVFEILLYSADAGL